MIAHLKGREKAIEELGLKPAEAEWIALVALHSGIFLRSQYGRFMGSTWRMQSQRLVSSLKRQRLAAEVDLPGVGRICHLKSRALYRALGAEHVRHRRDAARATLLRRLLSLDCVLGDPGLPWLPTEAEKVEAFESLGVERRALPKRIYGSRGGGRTVRPFGWKMPVAFGDGVARFVYVDAGGETQDELLSWGAEHLPLWSALAQRQVRLEVVAVAQDPERLSGADAILSQWRRCGVSRAGGGLGDAELDELAVAERALAQLDEVGMSKWGGLSGTIDRLAELQRRRDAGRHESRGGIRFDLAQALVINRGGAGVSEC